MITQCLQQMNEQIWGIERMILTDENYNTDRVANLSTTNLTGISLGSIPVLCGDRVANNCLSQPS
jgi:hypothetical protein